MRKIEEIDANFRPDEISADDVIYYDCTSDLFEINGLYKPYESEKFMRLPEYFSKEADVNDGVRLLMYHTAGGRVRFVTDSPYIAIFADVECTYFSSQTSRCYHYGFDMYVAEGENRTRSTYKKTFVAPPDLDEGNSKYSGFYDFENNEMKEITINFPGYSPVRKLLIGLKSGAKTEKPHQYTVNKPIVFYGSSITQGGCASRPGEVYTALLSNWLDADYINLGFSGSDRGEKDLAEYIKTIDMSAFVYAYGYNSPSHEHFEETHYPFYKIVREAQPDLPIVMMSLCVHSYIKAPSLYDYHVKRRMIAMKSYLKACEEGEKNIYFVDGFSILGNADSEECTVDGNHPNDYGFHNMASALYPVLKHALKNRRK